VSTFKALLLLVFRPAEFAKQADAHARTLGQDNRPGKDPQFVSVGRDMRRALGLSLGLVSVAVLIGYLLAGVLRWISSPPLPLWINAMQYIGIGLLLWATLAKQGWNIQTFNGNTLPERVDRAVYRTLYVVGSALLVTALAW